MARVERSSWQQIYRLRWPLAGAVGLVFAIGQLAEALLLNDRSSRPLLDLAIWGASGAAAVWLTLTWAARTQRRHSAALTAALAEQRRANEQLRLLIETNTLLGASATLDAILDTSVAILSSAVPRGAVAIAIDDGERLTEVRATGQASGAPPSLTLPLTEGSARVGEVRLWSAPGRPIAGDELTLLATIVGEISEALAGSRRRLREERQIYALDRAIVEERARIARDIHDGSAQQLAFWRMRVDLWRGWIADDPPRLDAELRQLKAGLRDQIQELRRAIFALRPVPFDELGFVGGLRRYATEFANQHGWQLTVDIDELPPLPTPIEALCFRVVQESLTNIAKHAAASNVAVRLTAVDQGLQITVRDNGRGFASGQELGDGRIGLRQMRERLTAMRGQLTVAALPEAGTEVRAWVPLKIDD